MIQLAKDRSSETRVGRRKKKTKKFCSLKGTQFNDEAGIGLARTYIKTGHVSK